MRLAGVLAALLLLSTAGVAGPMIAGHGAGLVHAHLVDSTLILLDLGMSGDTVFAFWGGGRYSYLTAYDFTGTRKWSVPLGPATDASVAGYDAGAYVAYADIFSPGSGTVAKYTSNSGDANWALGYPMTAFPFIDSSRDGETVILAYRDVTVTPRTNALHRIDPATGNSLWTDRFQDATGFLGIDVAESGAVWAASSFTQAIAYDAAGNRLRTLPAAHCCGGVSFHTVPALSADGNRWVTWTDKSVSMHEREDSTFVVRWTRQLDFDDVDTATISADGSALAVATTNFAPLNPPFVTCKESVVSGYRAGDGAFRWAYTFYGGEGNCVSDVRYVGDGSRLAVAAWGMRDMPDVGIGDLFRDQLTVIDTAVFTEVPVFRLLDDVDEQGSLQHVEITPDGRYVFAGGRGVHPNILGNGGTFWAIEMLT